MISTHNVVDMLSLIVIILMCTVFNGVVFGKCIDTWSARETDVCQPDCLSKIYCIGKVGKNTTLLHDVQVSKIYSDGTTFVKSRMKYSEGEILKNYTIAKNKNPNKRLNETQLEDFVRKNFENKTLECGKLDDFMENPPFIQKIENPDLKDWLFELNQIWKNLSRKMPESLRIEEETGNMRSSYIYVPNTFIVAGGRFDEMYYWDTYWIIKGLLACGMHNTTKGIIGNMIHLVKKYGFVPNGNRIYYSKRSQPPMLIQMVDVYTKETNDESIIKENMQMLEKEFKWWVANRRVDVTINKTRYNLFQYNAPSCFPRPESYKEDYELLENYSSEDPEATKEIYTGIRSAAESGWDFSSKHMRNPENAKDKNVGLRDTYPPQYAYVELNSIMYSNAKLLADWKRKYDSKSEAKLYEKWASSLSNAIENVLWNDEVGIWLDFDIEAKKSRNYFYASNFAPLWSKTYKNSSKVDRAIKYLEENHMIYSNLTSKYYGLPASADNELESKQQWDFPIVWAPLQFFIIRGLKESNNPRAEKVAYSLATSFLKTSYAAYVRDKVMYEKYDATTYGRIGSGRGEYEGSETGFGWTNGLVFELFNLWSCFPLTSNITCPNSSKI
ncbi:trehalase-like [Planococcus citri]|uniref:trehalase-like n=1 Tax=Planococcus citri TaxID=170843 RepID=UPI0031F9557A